MTRDALSRINVNVVCFTDAARILTPEGEVSICDLRVGDVVVTRDGPCPVRAISRRRLEHTELFARPNLWPVRIEPGALGPGVPLRRLIVSPQHRILIDSPISRRMTGALALIAARRLLSLPGVTQPSPDAGVTYVHLVFEAHRIVMSDGCWSESFYPGQQAMAALPDEVALEYRAIFAGRVSAAATIVEGRKAKRLVDRHLRNDRPLQVA